MIWQTDEKIKEGESSAVQIFLPPEWEIPQTDACDSSIGTSPELATACKSHFLGSYMVLKFSLFLNQNKHLMKGCSCTCTLPVTLFRALTGQPSQTTTFVTSDLRPDSRPPSENSYHWAMTGLSMCIFSLSSAWQLCKDRLHMYIIQSFFLSMCI